MSLESIFDCFSIITVTNQFCILMSQFLEEKFKLEGLYNCFCIMINVFFIRGMHHARRWIRVRSAAAAVVAACLFGCSHSLQLLAFSFVYNTLLLPTYSFRSVVKVTNSNNIVFEISAVNCCTK